MAKKPKAGFGAKLRTARLAAGLSQQALAEKVGMLYQAIARLERGDAEPAWATAVKLADALGVSLDEFRVEAASEAEAPPEPDEPELRRMPERRGKK